MVELAINEWESAWASWCCTSFLYFSKAVLPVLNSNSESASHDTAWYAKPFNYFHISCRKIYCLHDDQISYGVLFPMVFNALSHLKCLIMPLYK